jgi:hypothetical protein
MSGKSLLLADFVAKRFAHPSALPTEAASVVGFQIGKNRDGSSTRKLKVGVSTQPGPKADMPSWHCDAHSRG